jgi:hypothetical protein
METTMFKNEQVKFSQTKTKELNWETVQSRIKFKIHPLTKEKSNHEQDK